MKRTLTLLLYICPLLIIGQSSPVPLRSDVTIQRLMTVQDGVVRMAQDPLTNSLYYATGNANIYKVIKTGSSYHDSLVYTATQHGVDYPQCILFKDSSLYICGEENPDDPMASGIVRCGKLTSSGNRIWRTVMLTAPHPTCGQFDHKFSGMVFTPSGDSIVINSGARGDHGEEQTRAGMYPNIRNVPLTAKIFIVPTNDSTYLLNDSTWLANSGYIYAEGTRNNFSMAYAGNGYLFGLENSGDRDHNEEMNWLRRGHHYGFPYCMGDTKNPQQYLSYNCNTDRHINHYSIAWRAGAFHNDPSFPPSCICTTFDEPIQNIGPDCDKFRDTTTATIKDASDLGITIGTFTAHRSPLGLVFDKDSILIPSMRGDGFMLSWTHGLDSTGGYASVYDTTIGPFVDPSEDLVHLHMMYNAAAGKYTLSATRIIASFSHPVDQKMFQNKLYVIENDYTGKAGLFEVKLPSDLIGINEISKDIPLRLYPNPAADQLSISIPLNDHSILNGEIMDAQMHCVKPLHGIHTDIENRIEISTSAFANGIYFIKLDDTKIQWTGKFIVVH